MVYSSSQIPSFSNLEKIPILALLSFHLLSFRDPTLTRTTTTKNIPRNRSPTREKEKEKERVKNTFFLDSVAPKTANTKNYKTKMGRKERALMDMVCMGGELGLWSYTFFRCTKGVRRKVIK